ncbi:collagenase-like PrtC family protease [Dysgonomonas sp. PH5-45]|uniref:peptidase U32 family protein n=1 Tax=unclassified Dysgonomonas TaxID=2630389 RepID=UPI00247325F6|nr:MULTISPECIES: U32 family peptidase [unclassified Dysgonomonas]MDH6354445.1 collagenase-like PrtC family protease [Dysgonomonas sp. PH5-45]MDH6387344.1 collagenase-like PrtC family protease [Dysgonomonas sp. PH5-37]
MIKARKIELLAPAKNLECGIEAINHGADAVYIGAPKFSARSAAGSTIDDIATLTQYAHQFGARVYVALNTILKDEELPDAQKLIWDLYNAKADALIIQDMGILMLDLPPIALHASTQCDNRTADKVKFLEEAGFSQVVLARELSLTEIKKISSETTIPLEAFVHGALCVSYSGQCYLSEALSKRSANRGACAQFCRLPYDLLDAEGEMIQQKKYLLSMKDYNLSDQLEDLLDAGISSLKIEGRLKDVTYVKNTVAYYRQQLDKIIGQRPEYVRSSVGESTHLFEPNPEKSFNRGFTKYFLNGRISDIWSLNSPKSVGEPIGKVRDVFDRFFTLSATKRLNNGDGLCFLDEHKELQGIRINRVDGEKIFPAENNVRLRKGISIYRNYDHEFEKLLSKKSAERKIEASIVLSEKPDGFLLKIEDEEGITASIDIPYPLEPAQKEQSDNIKANLSKTGNTIFRITDVDLQFSANWFIPVSVLSDWRRQITDKLLATRISTHHISEVHLRSTFHPYPVAQVTYLGNVMNRKSKLFYEQHQSQVKEYAFEKHPQTSVPLMFTRHCIKHSLGWCPKEKGARSPYQEPYQLRYNDTILRLEFDCQNCQMKVFEA